MSAARSSRRASSARLLLLFANAFSAYATAAALVSQGSPIVPLQIRDALTSEVVLGQENVGKALALGMIVVVVGRHGACTRSSSAAPRGGSDDGAAAAAATATAGVARRWAHR